MNIPFPFGLYKPGFNRNFICPEGKFLVEHSYLETWDEETTKEVNYFTITEVDQSQPNQWGGWQAQITTENRQHPGREINCHLVGETIPYVEGFKSMQDALATVPSEAPDVKAEMSFLLGSGTLSKENPYIEGSTICLIKDFVIEQEMWTGWSDEETDECPGYETESL